MTQFLGPEERSGSVKLGYEETLNALLSLIGRQVLVLFSGAERGPFIGGVVSGRLDRGELDERLQELLLRDAPLLPLRHGVYSAATLPKVRGYQLHPLNRQVFTDISVQ